jgi:NADH-quinone oxidoreductase subunit L
MATELSQNLLLAVPLAPLAGSLVAGLAGKAVGRRGAHWAAILGVGIAFVISALVLRDVIGGARFNRTVYEWMQLGGLKMEIGFLVDGLTAMMMVVVTFVSLMVHIYTIGYMADDPGYQRFFSYISLFTFSMLMLVMSNNFLQLFFGWEAVGLVSYLLIGFWYTRPTAIFANLKAFIVNRVGDFGFILGIGLIVAFAGTLNYGEAFAKGADLAKLTFPGSEWMLITVICICLFIGAMGKSAQFPLHVWLPDSMEGPTPISALIHAATMVTAGIFMVARMSPLFELSDTALSVRDGDRRDHRAVHGLSRHHPERHQARRRLLDLSQLGYMTVALGASAYSIAVFHLMTHAFFKALLFLAAGSVIIGMHHDQDIRNMGGLRKYMPITWITSLLGSLALIGTPLFSGSTRRTRSSRRCTKATCRAPGSPTSRSRPACSSPRSIRSGCTSWSSTARSASTTSRSRHRSRSRRASVMAQAGRTARPARTSTRPTPSRTPITTTATATRRTSRRGSSRCR